LSKSIDTIFDLPKFSIEDFQQLKDIGEKVAQSVYEFFHKPDNLQIIEELAENGLNMKGDKSELVNGKLSGQTFLFTGTLPTLKRNDAEKMVEANGGKLLSSVSANLNYLVAGDSAGSKLAKAQKLKTVKIISEADFLNLIQS
jgi:DNA ligase (NAD+)